MDTKQLLTNTIKSFSTMTVLFFFKLEQTTIWLIRWRDGHIGQTSEDNPPFCTTQAFMLNLHINIACQESEHLLTNTIRALRLRQQQVNFKQTVWIMWLRDEHMVQTSGDNPGFCPTRISMLDLHTNIACHESGYSLCFFFYEYILKPLIYITHILGVLSSCEVKLIKR